MTMSRWEKGPGKSVGQGVGWVEEVRAHLGESPSDHCPSSYRGRGRLVRMANRFGSVAGGGEVAFLLFLFRSAGSEQRRHSAVSSPLVRVPKSRARLE
jgi:hypothetical protein